MRRTTIIVFSLLATGAFACSQFIPGVFPSRLNAVSGALQGSPKPQQFEMGHRPPIANARVELRVRTDKTFVEKTEDPSPYIEKILKQYTGAITKFECGELVATTRTDTNGSFKFSTPSPGKYCLKVVISEKGKGWLAAANGSQRPIDVVNDGGGRGLVIDVSPLQTTGVGGGTVVLQ
jgi:hypothetical protein